MNAQTLIAQVNGVSGTMHVVRGEWRHGHGADNRTMCGRAVRGNAFFLDAMDEITCKACGKAYSKAELDRVKQENTDRFIAESDARLAALDAEYERTQHEPMDTPEDVYMADWQAALQEFIGTPDIRLLPGFTPAMRLDDRAALVDAAVIVRQHAKDLIESVLSSHRADSFEPQCNPYVGDGVSFLTGTSKGSSDPLTRRVGEVMENISLSVGISGTIVFRSHIIREYGTDEVFEINSGRVRILNYGTWESTEAMACAAQLDAVPDYMNNLGRMCSAKISGVWTDRTNVITGAYEDADHRTFYTTRDSKTGRVSLVDFRHMTNLY
jgi:hypothetical protein